MGCVKSTPEVLEPEPEVRILYLPLTIGSSTVLIKEVDGRWRADNTELKDGGPTTGIAYRSSKDLKAREVGDLLLWGESVKGIEEGDGWLRCELPLLANGGETSRTPPPTRATSSSQGVDDDHASEPSAGLKRNISGASTGAPSRKQARQRSGLERSSSGTSIHGAGAGEESPPPPTTPKYKPPPPPRATQQPRLLELLRNDSGTSPLDIWMQARFAIQLQRLVKEHPYLEPGCSVQPHPLQQWIFRCRESSDAKKFGMAQHYLQRIIQGLRAEEMPIAQAFRYFDRDESGELNQTEFQLMCEYLGWGAEKVDVMDMDKDGKVTLPDMQAFIGFMGGVHMIYEKRRLRISTSRKDVCDYAGIVIGAHVRAHFYAQEQKSKFWRQAKVIAVGVEYRDGFGPARLGVRLEFGFGPGDRWRTRQVVPMSWVLGSVEDATVAAAMGEVGIMDEQQSLWAMLLPESEMHSMRKLEPCQRTAIRLVREAAERNHKASYDACVKRFEGLGFSERELRTALDWVQDLAPIVVHVQLDDMGQFLESDEFYRNQFETGTSKGALDSKNTARHGWERSLFGGAYENAKPFDRCKYGALNVLNDYRGVKSAWGYGDSYLVLKDVRLRTTFTYTDSSCCSLEDMAVLDRYAHVLTHYNDGEIKALVDVAMAAVCQECDIGRPTLKSQQPELLRGTTEDATSEWITVGFPQLAQKTGRYYWEVRLFKGCGVPQVGVLSEHFQILPGAASASGVGDDEHGFGADGVNSALWHGGAERSWDCSWPSKKEQMRFQNKAAAVLTEDVTVGVALILGEKRAIWFSSNGVWDDEPAFDSGDLPKGVAFYPAVSLLGRASFTFGPDFKHKDENFPFKDTFGMWQNMPKDPVRVDCPDLGDSTVLSVYKEIQVHGEVNLKRNVQRLVVNKKYRDRPKNQRSYDLIVTNAGACNGKYKREGERGGKFLYMREAPPIRYTGSFAHPTFGEQSIDINVVAESSSRGQWTALDQTKSIRIRRDGESIILEDDATKFQGIEDEDGVIRGEVFQGGTGGGTFEIKQLNREVLRARGIIYWEPAENRWKLNDTEDFSKFFCYAPALDSHPAVPPRMGWSVKDEDRGVIDKDVFQQTLEEHGVSADSIKRIIKVLLVKDVNEKIFRVNASSSFDEEWKRLTKEVSADVIWHAAVEKLKRRILQQAGFPIIAQIVETEHPYQTTRAWQQEVEFKNSLALSLYFSSKSCTLDKKARFRIMAGGLNRQAAGPGARVELVTRGGHRIHGKLAERDDSKGVWRVLLDRRRTPGGLKEKSSSSTRSPDEVEDVDAPKSVDDDCAAVMVNDEANGGDPNWPAVGDVVQAKYKNGCWYKATIAEVKPGEIQWYEAKRLPSTYVVDWEDGSLQDREKPLADLDRPEDEDSVGTTLEDLPRFSMVLQGHEEECVGLCAEEPKVALVNYGEVPGARDSPTKTGRGKELWGVAKAKAKAKSLPKSASKVEREPKEEKKTSSPPKKTSSPSNKAKEVTVGSEITKFELNTACPLTPITIAGFSGPGPAQEQGVQVGWFLDLLATLGPSSAASTGSLASRKPLVTLLHGLGGGVLELNDFGIKEDGSLDEEKFERQLEKLLDVAFRNIEEVVQLLNEGLSTLTGVALVFTNSSAGQQAKLLPEAWAVFKTGQRVNSEIKQFKVRPADKKNCIFCSIPLEWTLPSPKETRGYCDDCGLLLKPGLEWHHKPGTSEDYCQKHFDAISEDSKAEFIVIDEASKLGDSVENYTARDNWQCVWWYCCQKGPYSDQSDIARYKCSTCGNNFCEDCYDTRIAAPPNYAFSTPQVQVAGFLQPGPVQRAGVRTDWVLDIGATQARNPEQSASLFDKESLMENPNILLYLDGVTLVFTLPCTDKSQRFEGYGPAGPENWDCDELPGDSAIFEFSTDGDVGNDVTQRWGVWALVLPKASIDEVNPTCPDCRKSMKWSDFHEGSYAFGWSCNNFETCGGDNCSQGASRWFCAVCENDFCSKCYPNQVSFQPSAESVDRLADTWLAEVSKARGIIAEPTVTRDDWDESRLRALCDIHGWEFSWMTEDGERRRRANERQIFFRDAEQLVSARSVAEKGARALSAIDAL